MIDLIQYFRQKWSESVGSDVYPGMSVDDLALKPSAITMGDFYNLLVEARKTDSITNYDTMTEAQMDRAGGLFVIPRYDGGTASTIVRIRFNQKIDIELTDTARAVASNGVSFNPYQPTKISKNSFKDSEDAYSLYYVDVPFVAQSPGNQYNVEANTINQLVDVSFDYVSVTNPSAVVNGSKTETNEEYYDRLRYSMNDRSLMSKRGILSLLRTQFPVVSSTYISAAGDRYMTRDLADAVDASSKKQKVDYLGKDRESNVIKSAAYYQVFPPSPSSEFGQTYWGPLSAHSKYNYPVTILPVIGDLSPDSPDSNYSVSNDPAFFGYDVNQQYTNEMYRGVYFNDFNSNAESTTEDLFNIRDEGVSSVIPTSITGVAGWIYGASGKSIGDFGKVDDNTPSDGVMYFESNNINVSGTASLPIVVGKDISKRAGLKVTGGLVVPNVIGAAAHVIVGGVDNDTVNAFSGLGMGIILNEEYTDDQTENARLFITNSTAYAINDYYIDSSVPDSMFNSVSGLNSVAETGISIEPGASYDFEYIINDDLTITVYINKTAAFGIDEYNKTLAVPNNSMLLYSFDGNGYLNKDSSSYGTILKVTIDTDRSLATGDDIWTVSNLKAFDMNRSRATTMYALDSSDIDGAAEVKLRAFGNGSIGGGETEGYQAFIWNKDFITSTPGYTGSGGWMELSGITNPDGSKDALTSLLSHDISDVEKYKVDNQFGINIYIMLVASGTSKGSNLYEGDFIGDIHSRLTVDYISLESVSSGQYHTRNKADVNVVTLRSSDTVTASTQVVSVNNQGYYEISADEGFTSPVSEVVSVTINAGTAAETILGDSDYQVYQDDEDTAGSVYEKQKLSLYTSYSPRDITVEYIPYPDIKAIQDSFDSAANEKVYGDILVKHKSKCLLDITMRYTGDITQEDLRTNILQYIDDNNSGTFSTTSLAAYLLSNTLINGVDGDITMTYERVVDGDVVSDTVDTISITDVEFFYGRNISVEAV